jgi:hypothetical protein
MSTLTTIFICNSDGSSGTIATGTAIGVESATGTTGSAAVWLTGGSTLAIYTTTTSTVLRIPTIQSTLSMGGALTATCVAPAASATSNDQGRIVGFGYESTTTTTTGIVATTFILSLLTNEYLDDFATG